MKKATKTKVETVGDYFTAMAGTDWDTDTFLAWPPNAFCLAASLLQRTGAYIRLVKQWPARSGGVTPKVEKWTLEMTRRGRAWWEFVNYVTESRLFKQYGIPISDADWDATVLDPKILRTWRIIRASANLHISQLIKHKEKATHEKFWIAIFEIVAAADEASCGIGLSTRSIFMPDGDLREDYYLYEANRVLTDEDTGSSATLCKSIPDHLGTVLPKIQRGICRFKIYSGTFDQRVVRSLAGTSAAYGFSSNQV